MRDFHGWNLFKILIFKAHNLHLKLRSLKGIIINLAEKYSAKFKMQQRVPRLKNTKAQSKQTWPVAFWAISRTRF